MMMRLYHGRYQVTHVRHFAGDGSRIDSHRWYRLCNRYEGCSWVLRDDDKNAWVGFYYEPQEKND